MRGVVIAVVLASTTCGGDQGSTISCTTPASGTKATCSEISNAPEGSQVDQVRQACEANGGSFASAACDHAGSLGGCRMAIQGSSLTTVVWYYPSGSMQTQADVMSACTSMQATFVSP